jgi:hypothetical protein
VRPSTVSRPSNGILEGLEWIRRFDFRKRHGLEAKSLGRALEPQSGLLYLQILKSSHCSHTVATLVSIGYSQPPIAVAPIATP